MTPHDLLLSIIILALFLCLFLSAYVAVVTYRVVVTWRERVAQQEATQLNSAAQNPAGRARRRTVRASLAGGEERGVLRAERDDPAARDPAVRTRQIAHPRIVPRTLADAIVQTSFRLLDRSPARPTGDLASSLHAGRIDPLAPVAIPGPSAPRLSAPTLPASRLNGSVSSKLSTLDAPGPSSSQPDAPAPGPSSRLAVSAPGPSSSRLDPPCSGPAASNISHGHFSRRTADGRATAGSSSRRELARGANVGSPIRRYVRKITPRPKANQEGNGLAIEPSQVITSFYQPDEPGKEPLEAPPDISHDPELSIGDLFYHAMQDGSVQLWLWCIGSNGQPWWKQVDVGYQREDGKWLLITPHFKVPGWVTWDRFSRVFDVGALRG